MQTRAYELLAECRRSLYRLLADDDTALDDIAGSRCRGARQLAIGSRMGASDVA